MRRCEICGKKVTSGMTDEYGNFYTHDGQCFEKYMDKEYGKHCWMPLGFNEEDEYGGYYIVKADVPGGFDGTGIFYTDWEEDDDDDDDD